MGEVIVKSGYTALFLKTVELSTQKKSWCRTNFFANLYQSGSAIPVIKVICGRILLHFPWSKQNSGWIWKFLSKVLHNRTGICTQGKLYTLHKNLDCDRLFGNYSKQTLLLESNRTGAEKFFIRQLLQRPNYHLKFIFPHFLYRSKWTFYCLRKSVLRIIFAWTLTDYPASSLVQFRSNQTGLFRTRI